MPRIKTDQPSSGKPLLLYVPSTTNNGFVPTTWTTIVEAPDFTIPASGDDGGVLDPADAGRELRAGEVFIEAPLQAINHSATRRWVELQMLLEGSGGQAVAVSPQIAVPAKESIFVSIQGLRLLKTNLSNTGPGGRLQVRAEAADAITVIGTAVELEALNHAPDTEA